KVCDERLFGGRGFEPERRKDGLLQAGEDRFGKGRLSELSRGKIERKRDLLRPGQGGMARVGEQSRRQLMDQIEVLAQQYERLRRNKAPLRMGPPRQGLEADNLTRS